MWRVSGFVVVPVLSAAGQLLQEGGPVEETLLVLLRGLPVGGGRVVPAAAVVPVTITVLTGVGIYLGTSVVGRSDLKKQ